MKLVQLDDNDPRELPPKTAASPALARLVIGCVAAAAAIGLWFWFG
jgi:hypothetical protein